MLNEGMDAYHYDIGRSVERRRSGPVFERGCPCPSRSSARFLTTRDDGKESSVNFYASYAERVIDNGYGSVVAVVPEQKRPRYPNWQTACFKPTDERFLAGHVRKHPNDSVGIACGYRVIAVDIDAIDEMEAHRLQVIATETFGYTPLVRVGRWPKRLLVYRAAEPIDTLRIGKVDILGRGAQFVAFGVHPTTKAPYGWIDGSPADNDVCELPMVGREQIKRFANEAFGNVSAANDNKKLGGTVGVKHSAELPSSLNALVVRDEDGRVIDGREAFLTQEIYRFFCLGYTDVRELALVAWRSFSSAADLRRPKGDGRQRWTLRDAQKKGAALLKKSGPEPKPSKSRRRRRLDPSRHVHSHRLIDFWTAERKLGHRAETASRTTTSSLLIVNQAMLDAISAETGQCVATVTELAEQTGLAKITVKQARQRLVDLGLWMAERGVYVPVPLDQNNQATADPAPTVSGKGMGASALYRSMCEPLAASVANDNGGTHDRMVV